jgi:hypothetical protein
MICKYTKKYIWYENPKYYLAATLLVWGLRLVIEASHKLLPTVILFNGSMLDVPLYIALFASLLLLIMKGWRNA